MATTIPVRLCPGCRAELPEKIPATCPGCHKVLVPPKNEFFDTPDYVTYQRQDHQSRLLEQPPSAAREKESRQVEAALGEWAKTCRPEDREAALSDAYLMLSHALLAPMPGEALRRVVHYGKKIGELAKAIDAYITQGGATAYVGKSEPVPAEPGDGDGGEAAAD